MKSLITGVFVIQMLGSRQVLADDPIKEKAKETPLNVEPSKSKEDPKVETEPIKTQQKMKIEPIETKKESQPTASEVAANKTKEQEAQIQLESKDDLDVKADAEENFADYDKDSDAEAEAEADLLKDFDIKDYDDMTPEEIEKEIKELEAEGLMSDDDPMFETDPDTGETIDFGEEDEGHTFDISQPIDDNDNGRKGSLPGGLSVEDGPDALIKQLMSQGQSGTISVIESGDGTVVVQVGGGMMMGGPSDDEDDMFPGMDDDMMQIMNQMMQQGGMAGGGMMIPMGMGMGGHHQKPIKDVDDLNMDEKTKTDRFEQIKKQQANNREKFGSSITSTQIQVYAVFAFFMLSAVYIIVQSFRINEDDAQLQNNDNKAKVRAE